MKPIKCMLACTTPDSLDVLHFPMLVSKKLDGVRCLVIDGVAYSRNMKPIPSPFVQHTFGRPELNGLDGELIAGPPNAPDVYRRTVSAVMGSESVDQDVTYHVFDITDGNTNPLHIRLPVVEHRASIGTKDGNNGIVVVQQSEVFSLNELLNIEAAVLDDGYEGLIMRDPSSHYKNGRSTIKEQGMVKLKRFVDGEARIIGFEEKMHNGNEAVKNALGHTERSTAKAGKTGVGTLGALCVEDLVTGVKFNIGTGFDDKLRAELWDKRDTLPGKLAKYKSFPIGTKDAPRFPVFLGFRSELDM